MKHAEKTVFDFGPLARHYDRWYATSAGRSHDRAQKRDVRHLLQTASHGERLLDVGCGTGHWTAMFAEMGYQVTGVDLSPEMIEVARERVPGCSFRVADACELPFGDGSFDVVAAMATLEFMPDPSAAVREMVRCVRPGGRLLIGTLNRLAPLNQERLSSRRQPYASAHLFAPEELRAVLRPYGLVRMVASPVAHHGKQDSPDDGLPQGVASRRCRPSGPFIVAALQV